MTAATREAASSLEQGLTRAAWPRRIESLAPQLVTALSVVLSLRRLDNTDTWTILAAGRWIVDHRSVPATDTLSYTVTDHRWINVQWLFDVVFYLLHQLGGPTLLILASALVYGVAVALMMRNIRLWLGPLAATLLGLVVVVISQERFAIRPEMMSYLLIEVLLWLYATAPATHGRRLWCLALAMIVWANCHALFIIGAVVIGAHMASAVAERVVVRVRSDDETSRRVLVTGGASLAALLVNPFGLTGALFPFELMSWVRGANPAFRAIGELKPPFSGYFVTLSVTAYQVFFVASVVLVALATILPARRRAPAGAVRAARRRAGAKAPPAPAPMPTPRPMASPPRDASFDLAGVALFVALAYLSLQARRNMAIFAFGTAPFVARCLRVLADRVPGRVRVLALRAAPAALLLTFPAIVAAGWFVVSNGYYRWNGETHEFGGGVLQHYFPTRAADFVRHQKLPAPMFNDFTSGGYLAWSRPLPGGVYIDGRAEYGVDFYSAYVDSLREPSRWQAEVDRRGIQSVLFFHRWPNHRPLVQWLLTDRRWALLYYDEVALVLVRRSGNEALVASARASFDAARTAIEEELLAPPVWQWPIGRYQGLLAYGSLLDAMGKPDEAVRFYERLVDLRPAAELELPVRLQLARYHAGRNNLNTARLHLARAAVLDPENPGVAELRRRLGP